MHWHTFTEHHTETQVKDTHTIQMCCKYLTRLIESLPLLTFSSGKVCEMEGWRGRTEIKKTAGENGSLGPFQQCSVMVLQQQQTGRRMNEEERR